MVAARHKEIAFEQVIEQHLLDNGYGASSDDFDAKRAIFPNDIIAFVQTTQPDTWTKLEKMLGDKTSSQLLHDLCQWLDREGVLKTLRHGFKCYGRTVRIAYFKAAHGLNPALEERYAANRLTVTRQLHYSERTPNKSLDVVLSLNGIPLATLELKNPMTGQTAEDAKHQYRTDRDQREPIFIFKRRTLVHFAVDTEVVWMTTRLADAATHFLPFNRGANGGSGNPPDPNERTYRTAYLWEEVLARDSFLDLLARFLHLQVEEKRDEEGRKYKKETMIFPRYHQLQAVRKLVAAAASEGVGHNYLIEHSAGSGKSNTIGWLAHRLASLHNADDERIFDSVIVITDRRVLDQQLQDTIYQFEHKHGVVQKIDKHSRQLAQALENQVPVIITTLQKFPFVSEQLVKLAEERDEEGSGVLATHRYAVLVDEAHSSQSGDTATELRGVLGGQDLLDAAQQQAAEEEQLDLEDLFVSMAKRAQQANVSFIAFTATPKHKTLSYFGRNGEPFHRYTMQQAIEEGFILDVLRNYTTYKTYYKLTKIAEEDPNVERKKAAKTLARFLRLHPYNIAQKTEVMLEHFNTFTRHKIRGRAKAMVVTGSRLEAVRYKQAFDGYIKKHGYEIKTLVAFSGTVQDDKVGELTYTEVEMNDGIREPELPEQFATNEYQVLLVAEKYQTGFDQPLLHTMYVDKKLAGIQAVQTLSRLNRIHPHKEDTFILDFVNDRDEIQAAFKQFYEGATIGDGADPSQLYQLKSELDDSGIYQQSEVENFSAIYFKPKQKQSMSDHKAMNAALDPAVDRYKVQQDKSAEEADDWRKKVVAFRNLYSYLSQLIPYYDSDLEKIFVFLRHLSAKLPRRAQVQYDFDNDVALEYYRLQKISEGSIDLKQGTADTLSGPTSVGTKVLRDQSAMLSQVIDILNSRFGTDFNAADQLFFDQLIAAATQIEMLKDAAPVNTSAKFELLFGQFLENLFIERMDQNEEIFARYMNDENFRSSLASLLSEAVYLKLVPVHYMKEQE